MKDTAIEIMETLKQRQRQAMILEYQNWLNTNSTERKNVTKNFELVYYCKRPLTEQIQCDTGLESSIRLKRLTRLRKEIFGLVWKLLYLRTFVGRAQFAVRTDHDAFCTLKTQKMTGCTWKPVRWTLNLSELDTDVVCWTVIKHWQ